MNVTSRSRDVTFTWRHAHSFYDCTLFAMASQHECTCRDIGQAIDSQYDGEAQTLQNKLSRNVEGKTISCEGVAVALATGIVDSAVYRREAATKAILLCEAWRRYKFIPENSVRKPTLDWTIDELTNWLTDNVIQGVCCRAFIENVFHSVIIEGQRLQFTGTVPREQKESSSRPVPSPGSSGTGARNAFSSVMEDDSDSRGSTDTGGGGDLAKEVETLGRHTIEIFKQLSRASHAKFRRLCRKFQKGLDDVLLRDALLKQTKHHRRRMQSLFKKQGIHVLRLTFTLLHPLSFSLGIPDSSRFHDETHASSWYQANLQAATPLVSRLEGVIEGTVGS